MSLQAIYKRLYKAYGAQHWWPGDTPLEIIIGAILVQNTAWTNVEKAIAQLKAHDCLDAEAILAAPERELAQWLKPSGCFNIKMRRLRHFCIWYRQQGGYAELARWPTMRLRTALLAINGIGPETADSILLYAFDRPVFVIDAYTRRLFSRLGMIEGVEHYETLRAYFEAALASDVRLYNEYHALIVRHAREACRKTPGCISCALAKQCGGIESENSVAKLDKRH